MAEIIKMDDNTWRIEDDFVRFFLLTGTEKAVLLDSGANCAEARRIAESLTDLPILLLNTHGDMDHVSGTAAFSEIYMHKNDYTGCGVAEKFPDTALCEIQEGDCFDLGGRTLKIYDIPGHTRGSVAVLDVEKRTLFAGDSVQTGNIFMFGGHRQPELFGASLQKLMDLKPAYDRIVASHDEPVLEADYAKKVQKAWEQVEAGQVSFHEIDMFGAKVKAYTTEVCGFFYDK